MEWIINIYKKEFQMKTRRVLVTYTAHQVLQSKQNNYKDTSFHLKPS